MKPVTSMLTVVTFIALMAAANAAELPSCGEFSEKQTTPGASPECAPPTMPNNLAFEVLHGKVPVVKYGFEYYVVLPRSEWNTIEIGQVWFLLTSVVSAIQSLYGENSAVWLIVKPQTARDATALTLADPPPHLLVARARYAWRGQRIEAPAGHFAKPYVLIVYGVPPDASESPVRGRDDGPS
ncbi:MAG: hypothetical protein AB7N54_20030 [Alphaproteobacteria bacterium]